MKHEEVNVERDHDLSQNQHLYWIPEESYKLHCEELPFEDVLYVSLKV